ncbi:MAG: hypothetical protein PUI84_04295 [Bacteroidales bacterium]|nr:hypothetical protein [Porphyromonas sp.]MDD6934526.1 hypothetical protein [Bacteroidales bacterium]MDY3102738.1 hypothetical protein [Porphyromonas sp.]
MISLEKNELSRLVDEGYSFMIQVPSRPKWYGLKTRSILEPRKFTIHEPTLAILDRIARESIDIILDEEALKNSGADTIQEAKAMALKHAKRCARILAIAVLGEGIYKQKILNNGGVSYREDRVRIERLATLFEHYIKPSKLVELFGAIIATMNLGDFIYSIRLIQTQRTAMPHRIEEGLED